MRNSVPYGPPPLWYDLSHPEATLLALNSGGPPSPPIGQRWLTADPLDACPTPIDDRRSTKSNQSQRNRAGGASRYERGKNLLRACGAADDLQQRFRELPWEYSPGIYFAGQDTSDWPRYSREIRSASMKDATRILIAAADERRLSIDAQPATKLHDVNEFISEEVFIVYGHDHVLRSEVEIFLAAVTGTQPVVFDREPSQGSETVFGKLERLGGRAGFAGALMTPDDIGGSRNADFVEGRARQNVLIELGWFAGRLGRSRVRIVRHPDAAIPSDLSGILYTSTDGNWQTELAKDLRAAGLPVDLNALLK